jgi:broad specificity phosphatase PhoE
MRARPLLRATLVALAALAASAGAAASDADAWRALKQDGAIALVRHGDAPGIGDPAGWKLGDCPSQRNLDEAGRAQARALGAKLRAAGVAVGRVAASPWCRTVETATLLGVGAVDADPAFGNVYVLRERRASIVADARAALARWRGPGALVVVTHGETIAALTGRSPATAELVVVAVGRDGAVREVEAVETPPAR